MTYYYKQTETQADQEWKGPGLWTVGHHVDGEWIAESDHGSPEEAAARAHYLNGGSKARDVGEPAFPWGGDVRGGMTLRDWFAGQALVGLFASDHPGQPDLYYNPPASHGKDTIDRHAFIPVRDAEMWAKNAYRIADSMLAARNEEAGDDRDRVNLTQDEGGRIGS